MGPFKVSLALLCAAQLWSQDAFLVPGKGQPSCPLVESAVTISARSDGAVQGIPRPAQIKTLKIKGAASFDMDLKLLEPMKIQPAMRPKMGDFSVTDMQGAKTFLKDKVGKVLIIGFWHTACEPSIQWLQEVASLQEKEEKFGFIAYPVNVDPNQWTSVKSFMQLNRSTLASARVYRAGGGKEGYSGLIDPLPATPTILLIDRQGRLAQILVGYEQGSTVKALKALLVEPIPAP